MQVRWPLLALLGQSTASWAPTYVLRVPPRGVIHAVHRRCSKPPVAHLGAMPDQLEYERNAALNECTHLRAEVAAAREAHRTAVSEAKANEARLEAALVSSAALTSRAFAAAKSAQKESELLAATLDALKRSAPSSVSDAAMAIATAHAFSTLVLSVAIEQQSRGERGRLKEALAEAEERAAAIMALADRNKLGAEAELYSLRAELAAARTERGESVTLEQRPGALDWLAQAQHAAAAELPVGMQAEVEEGAEKATGLRVEMRAQADAAAEAAAGLEWEVETEVEAAAEAAAAMAGAAEAKVESGEAFALPESEALETTDNAGTRDAETQKHTVAEGEEGAEARVSTDDTGPRAVELEMYTVAEGEEGAREEGAAVNEAAPVAAEAERVARKMAAAAETAHIAEEEAAAEAERVAAAEGEAMRSAAGGTHAIGPHVPSVDEPSRAALWTADGLPSDDLWGFQRPG